MIPLNNLIDLLPSYYKEYDSYKDSTGKGLLEKFLNICGEYFKDSLIDLDEYLENHRVSDIDELYINNLWEFLGEFPFLQSDNFSYSTFAQIFNGDNLNEAKSKSRIKVDNLLETLLSRGYTVRNILPHVISLYKIRGTAQFFQIIFRLYNISSMITMVESYEDLPVEAKSRVPEYLYNTSVAIFKHYPRYEDSRFDKDNYDVGTKCNTCITRFFVINTDKLQNVTLDIIYQYIEIIQNLIDKFVPFYINPILVFTGKYSNDIYDYYTLSVTPDGDTLIRGSMEAGEYIHNNNKVNLEGVKPKDSIEVEVDIKVKYPGTNFNTSYLVGYKSSGSSHFIVDPNKVYDSSRYILYLPGQYVFIPVGYLLYNPNALTPELNPEGIHTGLLTYTPNASETGVKYPPRIVSISEDIYTSQWSMYAQKNPESIDLLDKPGDHLIYDLVGYLTYIKSTTTPEGSIQRNNYIQYYSKSIICIEGPKEVKPEGILLEESIPKKQFLLYDPGVYTFALSNYLNIRVKVTVGVTDSYKDILKNITLEIEPATDFIIRNKDFEPGSNNISSEDDFAKREVKGAYYLQDNIYKPWDRTIHFTCKNGEGKAVNVILTQGTKQEILKVDTNGEGSYTFPKKLGIYTLTPEGYQDSGLSFTIKITAWDNQPEVNVDLQDWYIQPTGNIITEQDKPVTINGYTSIKTYPSGNAPDYHPCLVLVRSDNPIPSGGTQSTWRLGEGSPLDQSGQVITSGGFPIGRIYQLNYSSGITYGAQVNLPSTTLNDNGRWISYIVKSIEDHTVLGQKGVTPEEDRRTFNLTVNKKEKRTLGFFRIASDKKAWDSLKLIEPNDIIEGGYTEGEVHWSKENSTFTIIPLIATLLTVGSNNTLLRENPYIELRDSEGKKIPSFLWHDELNEDEIPEEVTYDFPLEGTSKTITFYGIKPDDTQEELFSITLEYPEHNPRITSDRKSGEYPFGTTEVIVKVTAVSNRLDPPWPIYVNNKNVGITNNRGELTLSLGVPSTYVIYADMYNTGEVSNAQNPSLNLEFTVEVPTTLAPTANPVSGSIQEGTLITLLCDTPGAKIYYTLDGSEPTLSSPMYSTPISITQNTTIKAMAKADGYNPSKVVSFNYGILDRNVTATPVASVASGNIDKGTQISLTCSTPGAKIYYTLDGSTPTTSSTLYTGPLTINSDTQLKAIAKAEGYYVESEVAEYNYAINLTYTKAPKSSQPTESWLKPGTQIILTCDTPGAKIYYTLDGSEPTNKSTLYTSPITINRDILVKAFAESPGNEPSEIVHFQYYRANVLKVTSNESGDLALRYNTEEGEGPKLISLTANNLKEVVIKEKLEDLENFLMGTPSVGSNQVNPNITLIDVSDLDTSEVTRFTGAFQKQELVTEIKGIENLDVSKSIYFSHTFQGCRNLSKLNLSKWRTSSMVYMASMFKDCSNLTLLDFTGLDTSQATQLSDLFNGCTKLTEIKGIENLDVSKSHILTALFKNCKALLTIPNLNRWDTSQVTSMASLFSGCNQLTNISRIKDWDVSNVKNMNYMLHNCSMLTSLDLRKWNTELLENASFLFGECSALTSILGIETLNTSNIIHMSSMFSGCNSLSNLDLSKWDTSKVETLNNMFMSTGLVTMDISMWDFSSLKNCSSLFAGCESLESVNVDNLDTSRCTSLSSMFGNCKKLTSLRVNHFDTSQVTRMDNVFQGCESLTSLDLSNWDTSQVTNVDQMFRFCLNLTSLDLSNFDMSSVTKMSYMFFQCNSLNKIKCKQAFKDWCLLNAEEIQLPSAMQAGGSGTWVIV